MNVPRWCVPEYDPVLKRNEGRRGYGKTIIEYIKLNEKVREEIIEMKEKIKEDLDKFETIRNDGENQLIAMVLTDIIAKMIETKEDGTRSYENFDEAVNKVKEFLNNVDFTNIELPSLKDSIKGDVDAYEQIQTECNYSMRTLSWVLSLIEDGEEK